MKGVQQHKHDKADLSAQKTKDKLNIHYRRQAATLEDEKVIDGLSDEAVALVESTEELVFANPGVQLKLLKRLKQGHIPWEQGLDLHGYTVDQARDQLSQFILMPAETNVAAPLLFMGKLIHQAVSNP